MAVLHYVLRLDHGGVPLAASLPATSCCEIALFRPSQRSDVVALAEACRRDDPLLADRLSPPGLFSELTGREGRDVQAWLAWPPGAGPDFPATPLGLATLVAASSVSGRRFSIGWLLVHPAARRQGVGRALIATAVETARRQGAASVAVETLANWPAAVACWRAAGFQPVAHGS